MTDLEISKALALAIGWEKEVMTVHMGFLYVANWPRKDNRKSALHSGFYTPPRMPWQKFDYRDWNVIGPIAEKYDCFPLLAVSTHNGKWFTRVRVPVYADGFKYADTPQKAIAMAVIQGAKK